MSACYEHKQEHCEKHMAALTYPRSAAAFHTMRLFLGITCSAVIFGLFLMLYGFIARFGVWALYGPVFFFIALLAAYGVGWGVMSCYRLAKK